MSSEKITTGLGQSAIRYNITFIDIDDSRMLYDILSTETPDRIHVVDKFTPLVRPDLADGLDDRHKRYMIAVGRPNQSITERSLYTFKLSTFASAGLSKTLLGEHESRSEAVLETAAFIAGNKGVSTATGPFVPDPDFGKSDPDPFVGVGRTVGDLAALSKEYYETTVPVVVSFNGTPIGRLFGTDPQIQVNEAKLLASRKKVDISECKIVSVPGRAVNFVTEQDVNAVQDSH